MSRLENKYIFPLYEHSHLKKYLVNIKAKKVYNDRKVVSLYFDTYNFKFFNLSEEGLVPRSKIRLRKYKNDIVNFSDGNFEIKTSYPNYRTKILFKTNNKLTIINHNKLENYTKCLKYINLIKNKKLIPKLVVKYFREYFLVNNFIRITLDTNITYQYVYKLNFNKGNILSNIFKEKKSILEIKKQINNNLPSNIDTNFRFRKKRFSKYCEGIKKFI